MPSAVKATYCASCSAVRIDCRLISRALRRRARAELVLGRDEPHRGVVATGEPRQHRLRRRGDGHEIEVAVGLESLDAFGQVTERDALGHRFGRCRRQRVRRRLHLAGSLVLLLRHERRRQQRQHEDRDERHEPEPGRQPAEPRRPTGDRPRGRQVEALAEGAEVRSSSSCRSRISLLRLHGWPGWPSWCSCLLAGARMPERRRRYHAVSQRFAANGSRSASPRRAAPLYKRPEHLPAHLGDRGQLGPGHRDRRRARDRHRVRTRLGRHHPHRPAEAVSRSAGPTSGTVAVAAAGTPATSPSPNSVSRATTRPFGPRRSVRSNGSVRSATPRLAASLTNDPAASVRRRAAEIAALHPDVDLLGALHDDDPAVVEVAAWSCGEHESRRDAIVMRLIELAGACRRRARAGGGGRRARSDRRRTWRRRRSSSPRPTSRPFADVPSSHWHRSRAPRSTRRSSERSPTATGRSAKPPKTSAEPAS